MATLVRRSCAFCRRRKIRCSGESTGCAACVARAQPCLFEASSVMGRPRTSARKEPEPRPRRSPPLLEPPAADVVLNGMARLRLSPDVRTTFSHFRQESIGVLVTSFHGLVSSSDLDGEDKDPIPEGSSCRVFYESAFQAIPPLEIKSARTAQCSAEMASAQCWNRFSSELVSFATVGTPSIEGDGGEEAFFVRMLKEDESTPWLHPLPAGTPAFEDPILQLPPALLLRLVEHYFLLSPYSFLLNDALVLASLLDGTYDPALIAMMIGFVLSSSPNLSFSTTETPPFAPPRATSLEPATIDPASLNMAAAPPASSPPTLIDSPQLVAAPFLLFGERTLFARSAEAGASSTSTNQALLILGVVQLSQHKARMSWSVMASGLSCVRESLKRLSERNTTGFPKTELELVEEEQLTNLWWMFAIFGSWSFLSMNLPRSTLIDVADTHPLPPFTHDSSLSYAYRSTHSSIPTATAPIRASIRSFNETCRTLSLVITLSIKSGPKAMLKTQEVNARLPSDRRAFEYPFVADERLSGLEVWQLFVGKWLLEMAEQHSSSPPPPQPTDLVPTLNSPTEEGGNISMGGNSFATRKIRQSPFLSTVHAIMCLNKLAPFSDPEGKIELSAPALRLAVRAMELVVQGSAEKVRSSLGGDGRIEFEKAKTGLLRLVGDCLPHCLRIMDHLAETSQRSSEIYALLVERREAIAKLLEDLILLGDCGLRISKTSNSLMSKSSFTSVGNKGKNDEREVKRARSSTGGTLRVEESGGATSLGLWRSATTTTSVLLSPEPAYTLQPVDNMPDQESGMEELHSTNATFSLPYPFSFDSQLAPQYIALDPSASVVLGGGRPPVHRASSFTSSTRRSVSTNTTLGGQGQPVHRSLSHHVSMDSLYRTGTATDHESTQVQGQGHFGRVEFAHQLPSPTPSIHRVTSYHEPPTIYSPLSNTTPLPYGYPASHLLASTTHSSVGGLPSVPRSLHATLPPLAINGNAQHLNSPLSPFFPLPLSTDSLDSSSFDSLSGHHTTSNSILPVENGGFTYIPPPLDQSPTFHQPFGSTQLFFDPLGQQGREGYGSVVKREGELSYLYGEWRD